MAKRKRKKGTFKPAPKLKLSVQEQKDTIVIWLSKNRGVLSAIAEQTGVKSSYVSMVLSGKRKGVGPQGKLVFTALVRAGAPIDPLL